MRQKNTQILRIHCNGYVILKNKQWIMKKIPTKSFDLIEKLLRANEDLR